MYPVSHVLGRPQLESLRLLHRPEGVPVHGRLIQDVGADSVAVLPRLQRSGAEAVEPLARGGQLAVLAGTRDGVDADGEADGAQGDVEWQLQSTSLVSRLVPVTTVSRHCSAARYVRQATPRPAGHGGGRRGVDRGGRMRTSARPVVWCWWSVGPVWRRTPLSVGQPAS